MPLTWPKARWSLLAFGPTRQTISEGESASLGWAVGAPAVSAVITNSVGALIATLSPAMAGSTAVSPAATETYTLAVDGAIRAVTVTVLSRFSIAGHTYGAGGASITATDLRPGRRYDLFVSTNLETGTLVNAPVTASTSTTATFTDVNASPTTDLARFDQARQIVP